MDNVRYVNHLGDTLNLRGNGIFANYKDLKNFSCDYENSKLIETSKATPLIFVCLSKEKANELINVLESDSLKNKFGKLYINDWYIKVMCNGVSIVGEYADRIKVEISFYSEKTIFTKETEYMLTSKQGLSSETVNFSMNFPFNFGADTLSSSTVDNDEVLPADFILKFSSPVESVSIQIGSNSYTVNSSINSGEVFVLNTDEKEVYKETPLGKSSLLGAASDDNYIFETISSGKNSVVWTGNFNISMTVLTHRRTPPWI